MIFAFRGLLEEEFYDTLEWSNIVTTGEQSELLVVVPLIPVKSTMDCMLHFTTCGANCVSCFHIVVTWASWTALVAVSINSVVLNCLMMRFVRFVWWVGVCARSNPEALMPVTPLSGKSSTEPFSGPRQTTVSKWSNSFQSVKSAKIESKWRASRMRGILMSWSS